MLALVLRVLALLPLLTASLALKSTQTFTLRHVHTTHAESGHIRWADIPHAESARSLSTPRHTLETKSMSVHRPVSQAAFHKLRANSRKRRRENPILGGLALAQDWEQSLAWEEHDVDGPATDKRETLLVLAKMTNNAYFPTKQPGWYDLGRNWTSVSGGLEQYG